MPLPDSIILQLIVKNYSVLNLYLIPNEIEA